MMVEYRERVRRKYQELDAEKGTEEGEWRQYRDAFVGVAEELCGRTSGKRGYTEKQKPRMVDGRGGEGSGGEARSMEDDIMHYRQMGASTHKLNAPEWPEKRRQSGWRWTEHGGVWRKYCTESLTKMVTKR